MTVIGHIALVVALLSAAVSAAMYFRALPDRGPRIHAARLLLRLSFSSVVIASVVLSGGQPVYAYRKTTGCPFCLDSSVNKAEIFQMAGKQGAQALQRRRDEAGGDLFSADF